MNMPRPLSLVRFSADDLPKEYRNMYPFDEDGLYIFIGEIPNMPGHCVVMDHPTGKLHSGYHCEHFTEITEDE